MVNESYPSVQELSIVNGRIQDSEDHGVAHDFVHAKLAQAPCVRDAHSNDSVPPPSVPVDITSRDIEGYIRVSKCIHPYKHYTESDVRVLIYCEIQDRYKRDVYKANLRELVVVHAELHAVAYPR